MLIEILAAAVLHGAPARDTTEPAGCAVLRDFILNQHEESVARGRRPAVIDPRGGPDLERDLDLIIERFGDPAPPRQLVERLIGSRPYGSPVEACPSLAEALEVNGVRHTMVDVDAVMVSPSRRPAGAPRETVLTYALPVVSDDGTEAVTQNLFVSDPLALFAYFYFRFENGRWVRAGVAIMDSTTLQWNDAPAPPEAATD